jgi:hypothetical protein
MAAGNYFEDLVFKVIADTKSAQEGLVKLSGKMQELNKHTAASATGFEKFASKVKLAAGVATAAFALAATAVIAFSVKAVQAASENQLAITRLALTLKNVTGASEEATAAVEAYIRKLSFATGVLDDQLRPAMDQLARSTRNVADSQKLLALSLDISAGTGLDLLSVSTALGQAYNGNFSLLQRLKTGLSDATIQSGDFGKATTELAGIFKGQAEKQADTFTGGVNRLKVALRDTNQVLGTILMPAFQFMINLINEQIVPALNKFVKRLQDNPKAMKDVIAGLATLVKWSIIGTQFVLILADAFVLLGIGVTRAAQAWGWFTGNDDLKNWGRRNAEELTNLSLQINKVIDGLGKIDVYAATKNIKFDFTMPDASGMAGNGGGGLGTGLKAAVTAGWNDSAKAILDSVRKIKIALSEVLGFSIKQQVKDLSLDPLVKSLRDAKSASVDYAKAQNSLITATQQSAQADLAYIKSMVDVTDAGKIKTESLKSFADAARDNAISAASDTQSALQKIMDAQKAYADEVINRIKSIRSAFQSATQVDLGNTAQNIATANQNLADAQAALQAAQDKWTKDVPVQAYEGVIIHTALPIFEAEQHAVQQAQEDLAIALGNKKNPFLATVDQLTTALTNAYADAVQLSTVSGNLAGAGFSQDFITQIINAGPILGTQIGQAILGTSISAQNSFKDIFNRLQVVSETGMNDLSIQLNQSAINAMDDFITGMATVQDPLDQLMKAIEDRVNAMVTNIGQAIAAVMAQLAALANIQTPTYSTGGITTPWDTGAGTSNEGTSGGGGGGDTSTGTSIITVPGYGANNTTGDPLMGGLGGPKDPSNYIQVNVNNSINNDPHALANEIGYVIRTSGDVIYGYNALGNIRVAGRGD